MFSIYFIEYLWVGEFQGEFIDFFIYWVVYLYVEHFVVEIALSYAGGTLNIKAKAYWMLLFFSCCRIDLQYYQSSSAGLLWPLLTAPLLNLKMVVFWRLAPVYLRFENVLAKYMRSDNNQSIIFEWKVYDRGQHIRSKTIKRYYLSFKKYWRKSKSLLF
jgi:hypothetical protein